MKSVAAASCGALLALMLFASPAGAQDRFALANGCYSLEAGGAVAKTGDGYRVGGGTAEGFRMQATALGKYLLYGRDRDFLAVDGEGISPAAEPSPAANWTVTDAGGGAFRLVADGPGRALGVGDGGQLVAVAPGQASSFTFVPADGCAVYPEVDLSATGTPFTSTPGYGEARGLIDLHMHMMAFEFLGGNVHCGRPWHEYGAPYALVDCIDHTAGCGAVLENVLYGNPARCHDTSGWPEFRGWPHPDSLTHEQSYYRWLERAWMGGLRVFVNLFVENRVLCELYPLKRNSCDEMTSVRLQNRQIRAMQDYIDAQAGGPGKGFFRIVTDPFEARQVINEGKLAVVLGIEVSEPFGCQLYNDQPRCDRARIDRELDEVYGFGVRQMELINKFDNALAGVAGDSGETGVVVNNGNKYATGQYWHMQACDGPPDEADKQQPGVYDHDHNDLFSNVIEQFLPPGAAPVYPTDSSCNARGLSELGEHTVRRMMQKNMVVDPDHLSVRARKGVLALLEAANYSGVVSSHTWSTPDVNPRIYKLGGVITPYAGSSTGFVDAWKKTKPTRDPRYYFGFGYGADMNGFGAQGHPREGAPNPVEYPFRSFDGGVTLFKQRSGLREYDINVDGVAHYGLYPDWVEDLRKIGGNQIVEDMSRGAEAYLQMWERAAGVPRTHCLTPKAGFEPRGFRRLRLGHTPRAALMRAGQPLRRTRAWTYCVKGKKNRKAKVVTVFTGGSPKVGLVASTARRHTGRGIGPRARASRLRGTKRVRGGLRVRRFGRRGVKLVYGVRRGRVRFVAVASRSVARSPKRLRAYLKLARVR
jgi:hypothetical protein